MSTPKQRDCSALRGVAVALIAMGIVFGPLAFGATEVWSRCVLQLLVAAGAVLWFVAGVRRPRRLLLPVLVLLLGLAQLAPLPHAVLSEVSPVAAQASDAVEQLGVGRPVGCASVCFGATVAALRQLLLMVVLAVMVADLAARPVFRWAIAATVATTGLIVLALGLSFPGDRRHVLLGFHDMAGPVQPWKNPLMPPLHGNGMGYRDLVRVGGIMYAVDAPVVGDGFGPYPVSNHFAGCLELTIPVAVGLLLGLPLRSRWRKAGLVVAGVAIAAVALDTVAFAARSWGGAAGLAAAGLAVAVLALRGRAGRIVPAALLLVVLAGCVMMFGHAAGWFDAEWLPGGLKKPLEQQHGSASRRLDAWRAAGQMFQASPLLGVGLGNYGNSYPSFAQPSPVTHFAHNDYLQWAAETGLVGLALAASLIALGAWRLIRSATPHGGGLDRGLYLGLCGAAAALAVHSVFDYNLHVPANGMLAAVVAGLLWGMARAGRAGSHDGTATRRGLRRLASAAVITLLVICGAASIAEMVLDRDVQPLREALVAARPTADGSPRHVAFDQLREAMPAARRAAQLAPWRADFAGLVGRAYLDLSNGRPCEELSTARSWFGRSLRWCPIDAGNRETVQQIDAVLSEASRDPPAGPAR